MRKLLFLSVFLLLFSSLHAQQANLYAFSNTRPVTASRATIEAYLARALTMQSLLRSSFDYHTPTAPYNIPPLGSCAAISRAQLAGLLTQGGELGLIQAVGAKYIHRAEGVWANDWEFGRVCGRWTNVANLADIVHHGIYGRVPNPARPNVGRHGTYGPNDFRGDPEIILEAGLFEAVWNGRGGPAQPNEGIIDLYSFDSPYLFAAFPALADSAVSAPDPAHPGHWVYKLQAYNMLYDETQEAIRQGVLQSADDTKWYVPDMTKLATQVWFYFRACEYIKRGFESIHMGRMDLMLKKDCNNVVIGDLVSKIRRFGQAHARRGIVLLNSSSTEVTPGRPVLQCSPGFNAPNTPLQFIAERPDIYFHKSQVHYTGDPANRRLLWDWGAAGITMVEDVPTFANARPVTLDQLKNVVIYHDQDPAFRSAGHDVQPPYNRSAGGQHPQGWYCEQLPYYVEWDTSIGYVLADSTHAVFTPISWNFTYSMDDRAWFVSLPKPDRKAWLRYAYRRVKELDRNAFLTMPGLFGSYRYNSNYNPAAYNPADPATQPFKFNNLFMANLPEYDLVGTIQSLWAGETGVVSAKYYPGNFWKNDVVSPTFLPRKRPRQGKADVAFRSGFALQPRYRLHVHVGPPECLLRNAPRVAAPYLGQPGTNHQRATAIAAGQAKRRRPGFPSRPHAGRAGQPSRSGALPWSEFWWSAAFLLTRPLSLAEWSTTPGK